MNEVCIFISIVTNILGILNQNLISTILGTMLGVYVAFRLAANDEKKKNSYRSIVISLHRFFT